MVFFAWKHTTETGGGDKALPSCSGGVWLWDNGTLSWYGGGGPRGEEFDGQSRHGLNIGDLGTKPPCCSLVYRLLLKYVVPFPVSPWIVGMKETTLDADVEGDSEFSCSLAGENTHSYF